MIVGAEKFMESGRLVYLLRCDDCGVLYVRDDATDRCAPCRELYASSMAGQMDEVTKAAGALWSAILEALAPICEPVLGRIGRLLGKR